MKHIEQLKDSFIGIDVSKLTLDVSMVTHEQSIGHLQVKNTKSGFKKMQTWLIATGAFNYSSALFCMEHTGIYTRELVEFLLLQNAKVWLESPLHLKKSMGMTRGKNDKIDSFRISRYAMTNSDKSKLVTLSNKTIQLIKDLMTSRNRIKKSLQSIKISIKEMESIDKATGKGILKLNKPALAGLTKSKEATEKRITELINSDDELKSIFESVSYTHLKLPTSDLM